MARRDQRIKKLVSLLFPGRAVEWQDFADHIRVEFQSNLIGKTYPASPVTIGSEPGLLNEIFNGDDEVPFEILCRLINADIRQVDETDHTKQRRAYIRRSDLSEEAGDE